MVYLKFHRIFERKHFTYVITEMVWSNFDPALHLAEVDDELNYGRYHQNIKLMTDLPSCNSDTRRARSAILIRS
jgi:hypothetical protein